MYTRPCITVGDTGQQIPFWQLSMDHNMDVHKDVHLQVNADYALDTWVSMPGYKKTAYQSTCSIIAI